MVTPLRAAIVVCAVSATMNSALAQTARPLTLVQQVRAAVNEKDLSKAEAIVASAREAQGDAPEVLAAYSWIARGAQSLGNKARAEQVATEVQRLAVRALAGRPADADANLAIAIGAAIEVQALLGADRGERSAVIAFLERELKTYRDTSVGKRIQKNINLLTLEGHAAPPLERTEWIGTEPPPRLSALTGKVVVLFFWAHWCPDCKIQGPILEKLYEKYREQGLIIVSPTMRFGYVANGKSATPDEELKYIVEIRDRFYPWMTNLPTPVSVANHERYGVSTSPTLAIVDRKGIIRTYNPGRMTEADLEARITALLSPSS